MASSSIDRGVNFSLKALIGMTDNFSDGNVIGKTEFYKLFRGRISELSEGMEMQEVSVKIWDNTLSFEENLIRLKVKFRKIL